VARIFIGLYCREGQAAWDAVVQHWPDYRRSLLLHVQLIRIEMQNLRARCALAASATSSDRRWLLRAARRCARWLDREEMPWATAHAQMIRAGLAAAEGNLPRAAAYLADSAAGFEAAHMRLHAATARRRLGMIYGGAEGQALIAEADAWMTSQEIRNPGRMMAAFTSGFPDESGS
jgi:hypothetical protein